MTIVYISIIISYDGCVYLVNRITGPCLIIDGCSSGEIYWNFVKMSPRNCLAISQ